MHTRLGPVIRALHRPLWMLLAVLALWWPARVSGPLDGIPLDTASEAILLGLAFPVLCWLHPAFLDWRGARAMIAALLALKLFASAALVRDGWCVTMLPDRPYVTDGTGAPHSWDVRADWRSPDPSCTAIMTRSYTSIDGFPAWFFNLPPATSGLPVPEDLPPSAVTRMRVHGVLVAPGAGTLDVAIGPDMTATLLVDEHPIALPGRTAVTPGFHRIAVDGRLTGEHWRFEPMWNGAHLWTDGTPAATAAAPSRMDLLVRPWGRWIWVALAATLLIWWTFDALRTIANTSAVVWMVASGGALALTAKVVSPARWHWTIAALAFAALVPATKYMRNARGAFLLIAVPWLAFVVTTSMPLIGRMTFYTAGDDWWLFQRFAYRIVLQGYWLEGGERTFWFQPLYRWIAGLLHVVFGDSSVGEVYWDAACLSVMALFSFSVTNAFAGFRWGLAAAALTLGVFMAGPGFTFVGRGLSEISSAGFLYLAAHLAIRSRTTGWPAALGAGVCALLGTFTRLNNLPMAVAVAAFAWPILEPTRALRRPAAWIRRASLPTITIVLSTLAAGLLLFALRTWYYTGVFSVFLGTALDAARGSARRVWQPGMTIAQGLQAMLGSLLMVLTTTDPPHLHNGALPLLAGAVVSAVALFGWGRLGDLPLGPVLFSLASLAGSLVARGVAYSGRFSIHIIGAMTTVLTCAVARVMYTRSSPHEIGAITPRVPS